MQLLHSQGEGVIRKASQRLHVKWYHGGTERIQSLLRVVGIFANVCNLVPHVVQACQACRLWRRLGQSNTFTFGFSVSVQRGGPVRSVFLSLCVSARFGMREWHPKYAFHRLLYSMVSMYDVPIAQYTGFVGLHLSIMY